MAPPSVTRRVVNVLVLYPVATAVFPATILDDVDRGNRRAVGPSPGPSLLDRAEANAVTAGHKLKHVLHRRDLPGRSHLGEVPAAGFASVLSFRWRVLARVERVAETVGARIARSTAGPDEGHGDKDAAHGERAAGAILLCERS